MTYCIEIHRELEDVVIEHKEYDHEPSRDEILEYIMTLELNYDDNYGKFNYWKVNGK